MLVFNRKIKQSAVSTEYKRIYNLSIAAVGSESDCISRDHEFDSGLARFNTFAEIDYGIISTAPASIKFRATKDPQAKRDSGGVMLAG